MLLLWWKGKREGGPGFTLPRPHPEMLATHIITLGFMGITQSRSKTRLSVEWLTPSANCARTKSHKSCSRGAHSPN